MHLIIFFQVWVGRFHDEPRWSTCRWLWTDTNYSTISFPAKVKHCVNSTPSCVIILYDTFILWHYMTIIVWPVTSVPDRNFTRCVVSYHAADAELVPQELCHLTASVQLPDPHCWLMTALHNNVISTLQQRLLMTNKTFRFSLYNDLQTRTSATTKSHTRKSRQVHLHVHDWLFLGEFFH